MPLAAEEARDPARAMPRGIVAAMGVLACLAVLMLVVTPGVGGSSLIATSGNPPVDALSTSGAPDGLVQLVNYIGLVGLVASFFSIIYAYSRQTFALSRAGYLPRPAVGDQSPQGADARAARARRDRLRPRRSPGRARCCSTWRSSAPPCRTC